MSEQPPEPEVECDCELCEIWKLRAESLFTVSLGLSTDIYTTCIH